MSTDLKSHAKNVTLTRFWGGQRGSCVQVTQPRKDTNLEVAFTDKFFTSLQLTRAQAAALAADLQDFAQGREEAE
tara:strand:+ start:3083 stop:3307 length:225 start_codon:yes stop_codon:yes gene_type:complete